MEEKYEQQRGTETQLFDIQEGWDVYSADDRKVGDVHEIHRGTAGEPGYFVVQKGMIFTRDLYVPFDQIDRVERDRVFLKCGSDMCDRMGWDERPSYARG